MVMEKPRILFVSAADPVSEIESRLRPLWPCFLVAYIEKHLGTEACEFHFLKGSLEKGLRQHRPHIVGISSVTQNFGRYAVGYASLAKRHGAAVLVGGMHITSVPGCLTDDMDVGCIGEGEETFLDLVRLYLAERAFKPSSLAGIQGIAFHDGAKVVTTPPRPFLPSLDLLPHPKRELVGYARRGYLYTARGCAYKCVFCSCTRYWGTVRYSAPEYVLQEIRDLISHGVRIIRFNDENFIGDPARFRAIAKMVVAEGLHRKAKFTCWCRANCVTEEIASALRAMNVVSVKMGLESGCDRTLEYLKGGVTVEDNMKAIERLKRHGMVVNADFIMGAPQETEAEIMETYEFIKNSRLDFVDVNILTPLPGTAVWEYALKRGLVSQEMEWGKLTFKFQGGGAAPLLSESLSREQLQRLHRKFQRLRAIKALKALKNFPWRAELPALLFKKVRERLPHRVSGLDPRLEKEFELAELAKPVRRNPDKMER